MVIKPVFYLTGYGVRHQGERATITTLTKCPAYGDELIIDNKGFIVGIQDQNTDNTIPREKWSERENKQIEMAIKNIPRFYEPSLRKSYSSYGIKHVLENNLPTEPEHGYIHNGSCIKAFLHLGYRVKVFSDSPNVIVYCKELSAQKKKLLP